MLDKTAKKHWNYLSSEDCSLEDFKNVISQSRKHSIFNYCDEMAGDIGIYDAPTLRKKFADEKARKDIYSEWANQMDVGCGIVIIKNAYEDVSVIDRATEAFNRIIESERGRQAADHFAKKGANDRIWNALEKLCKEDPETFSQYYANDMIAALSQSWLGPSYQVTSQVNVVRPGGEAQQPHRDYHLGFQSNELASQYPAHVHKLSAYLTLQGAVAHCDMPLESGPTKLLPFSQTYLPGYLAYRLEEFKEYFEENYVQVPLEKGDLLFFNPAVFHSAGSNQTENIFRMANLMQVSVTYGIAIETVGRADMSKRIFPVLKTMLANGELSQHGVANVIAASADGYAFPTNLDTDPPVGGLAPKTQQILLHEALAENWDDGKFNAAIDAMQERRKS